MTVTVVCIPVELPPEVVVHIIAKDTKVIVECAAEGYAIGAVMDALGPALTMMVNDVLPVVASL